MVENKINESDKPLGLIEQIRQEQANKPSVRLEDELNKTTISRS